MLNLVLNVFSILIQALACGYFIESITQIGTINKYDKNKRLIIYLSLLLLVSVNRFIAFPYNTIISIVYQFFLVSFILKVKPIKSLFFSIIFFVVLSILEIVCVYLFMIIFNQNGEELLKLPVYYNLVIVMHSVLLMFITYLINTFANKKEFFKNFFIGINLKQIRFFLIVSSICIIPQIIIFALNRYNYSIPFLILNSIQMIIFCLLIFTYIKRSAEYEKTQNELTISELHNKTMVSMVDGVRILKHDYNNIIQAMSGYVSTKQYDKLEEHISKVLKECNAINTTSTITPELFNEPAIYGIVGAKYFIAIEKEITVDVSIGINISEINFPMPELSRILGILLDNAIEATCKVPSKHIKIEFKYDQRKNADVIKIYNTFDTTIKIDLEKIFNKDFSTKEIKSGIGLWEAKKLVNKTKNAQIYATIEKDKFVQNIIVER
ncbi:MAG: GHKL domain-containing protein [Clostridia bacterium]|nr:GHKL domain-containing protein [Clostridia bacterium]